MRVGERMTPEPETIGSTDTLAAAKALMDARGFRRLPVVDAGRLVGILTERDIRQHWGYLDATRVDAAMTPNPVTITPEESVQTAARLMISHKIGGLPVMAESRVVGMLTTTDVIKAFLDLSMRVPAERPPARAG